MTAETLLRKHYGGNIAARCTINQTQIISRQTEHAIGSTAILPVYKITDETGSKVRHRQPAERILHVFLCPRLTRNSRLPQTQVSLRKPPPAQEL